MDRLSMEAGRAVRSTQGRDAGRYFIILQVLDDQFVMMADGLTRKLDHPKKKKIKHLKPKPVLMGELETLRERNQLQDATIRKFLNDNGLGLEQSLCPKEEEAADAEELPF